MDLQATQTAQPKSNAQIIVERSARREFTEVEQNDLAIDLCAVHTAALSARNAYDQNLAAWSSMYELEVDETDWPWVGSSNLIVPIIPSELDTFKSTVSQQVFVQRLIIVSPGDEDPETARLAPLLEKYYNAELRRIRKDGKTPISHLKTILHLGLRDGCGPCEVLVNERVEPKVIVSEVPAYEGDNVVIDEDTGHPKTRRERTVVKEKVVEVVITPGLLKETYLVPDESTSLGSAVGHEKIRWMYEKELREKVAEGTFNEKAVEQLLNWNPNGTSDVASDPKGTYDKDAGGQISIGQAQGSLTSKFFANRGPFEVIQLYTEQFDFDEDKIPEKNILWFYARTPLYLGHTSYEYADDRWPTFMWNPFPRPNRPYGYSLVERLADLTADVCAGRNQRRNYIDMALMPVMLEREGDAIRDKNRVFAPGVPWSVEDVERSVKWFVPPPLSTDSFTDEARSDVYISKLTGQNNPAQGAQSSGRRTATESRAQNQGQMIRSGDVATDFREFIRDLVQFWHRLNKQYPETIGDAGVFSTTVTPDMNRAYGDDEKSTTLTLPSDIFSRKFNIDVAGLSDPTDSNTRRTELMGAIGVIQKAFPWIVGDPVLSYNLAEQFFETFNFAAIERFIGTSQEAQARKAQMAAQAPANPALGAPPGGAPPPGGGATSNGVPQNVSA